MKLLKIDSGKAVRVSSQIGRLGWKLSSRNWRKQEDSVSIQTHITNIKQNGTLETEFIKVWKLSGNAWKRLVKKKKSIFKFKLN